MISGSSCLTCDFDCFIFRLLSGVDIILRNYHSRSSVVNDEGNRTLTEMEEI